MIRWGRADCNHLAPDGVLLVFFSTVHIRGAIFSQKVITGTVPAPAKESFYRHVTAV